MKTQPQHLAAAAAQKILTEHNNTHNFVQVQTQQAGQRLRTAQSQTCTIFLLVAVAAARQNKGLNVMRRHSIWAHVADA